MSSIYAAGAPPMIRVAAGVQALEAAGLCVAAVAQVTEVASGHAYQASNGAALAVLEFITVALMAWIARGIALLRPWSRTPAVMTQILVGLLAIILLQSQRYDWGIPALVLAIAGLAGLFSPASLRALRRPDPEPAAPEPAAPEPAAPKKAPAKRASPGRKSPAGSKRK